MKFLSFRFFIALIFIISVVNCKSPKDSADANTGNTKKTEKPLNLVLILMDDQGYDTSIDGITGIKTPNFDALPPPIPNSIFLNSSQ
mgnify:CR=1 FL=1